MGPSGHRCCGCAVGLAKERGAGLDLAGKDVDPSEHGDVGDLDVREASCGELLRLREESAGSLELAAVERAVRKALQHPGDPIEIPTKLASSQVDYECELAVIIGKRAKNVSKADANRHQLPR